MRHLPTSIAVALVACLLAAVPARAELLDRVLAVVGGEVVTLSDVQAAVTFGFVQVGQGQDPTGTALPQLIDRQLMLADVNRSSAPEPDAADVERQVQAIRARFPSAGDFAQALARTAMTEGRLRDMVQDSIRIERYIDQRFAGAALPTDEDVARYYAEHQGEFTENGRVQPFEAVQDEARRRETARRRDALIADWVDRLRRQTDVMNLYVSAR